MVKLNQFVNTRNNMYKYKYSVQVHKKFYELQYCFINYYNKRAPILGRIKTILK
jgi:hypothetical protein